MVKYFREDTKFVFRNRKITTLWIKAVIAIESEVDNLTDGDINIIFCSDNYLLNINKQYLKHDFYTDIVTFDNCSEGFVSGDLFISIDTVKKNAKIYFATFEEELNRVIIHGILHLLGHKDKTKAQFKHMKDIENNCLIMRHKG